MIAFLKRRWILLTCAVALLACSLVDYNHPPYLFQISEGNITSHCGFDGVKGFHFINLHRPIVGGTPQFRGSAYHWYEFISIPLWLPLAAIVGWIVFRELRWREKRARKAEQATGSAPDAP